MDKSTRAHLNAWLEREFSGDEDVPLLRDAMVACYERDPEFYGSAGWWRVYDVAMARSWAEFLSGRELS
jgi:hypothetical protein